jgi:hypothetical protein
MSCTADATAQHHQQQTAMLQTLAELCLHLVLVSSNTALVAVRQHCSLSPPGLLPTLLWYNAVL